MRGSGKYMEFILFFYSTRIQPLVSNIKLFLYVCTLFIKTHKHKHTHKHTREYNLSVDFSKDIYKKKYENIAPYRVYVIFNLNIYSKIHISIMSNI